MCDHVASSIMLDIRNQLTIRLLFDATNIQPFYLVGTQDNRTEDINKTCCMEIPTT